MRSSNNNYIDISENRHERREETPWYWRLIALVASWMILGGYLILPGLYAKDPQLKIRQAVLSVFVVALLTAGYSFTALLCFACRNEVFQAEGVFLPAMASSAFGLVSIAYNFGLSRAYAWQTSSITGTVVSAAATLVYGALLLWTYRRIFKMKEKSGSSANLWSEQSYYSNFVQNMYPTATRSPSRPPEAAISEDDRVNQQMALLLMNPDARPSPDANSTTFRIDLPEDREEQERHARSQELVGTPGQTHADWNRNRADSRPDSLSEQQAWQQWQDRGRTTNRPSSTSGRSSHSRNLSREERRREIELGHA
ncbi:Nn.00g007520.m01.CDS01 [Neocucurbitaria sp. VM-36]